MSIFRDTVIGSDGTIDPGYLGLFTVIVLILGTIPCTLVLVTARMFLEAGHPLDLVGLGAVIAGAGAAFGTAAGGVGLFRVGDKPAPTPPAPAPDVAVTVNSKPTAEPAPCQPANAPTP